MIPHTWKYLLETPDVEDCLCTVCGYRRTYRRISETGWQAEPLVPMTSCPGPPDDMILFPRSLVAALVTPWRPPYIGTANYCNYCYMDAVIDGSCYDLTAHTPDCPIRIAQALLQEAESAPP